LASENKLELLAGGEKQGHIDRLVSFHIPISLGGEKSVLLEAEETRGTNLPHFTFISPGLRSPLKRLMVWATVMETGLEAHSFLHSRCCSHR
jgi:hypothetical protein